MRNFNASDFMAARAEWQGSGLSIREYCRTTGITESRFHYWKRKTEMGKEDRTGDFLPVNVSQNATGKVSISRCGTDTHSQAIRQSQLLEDCCCEIVYPNGVKLRIRQDLNFESLKSLLTLF